MLAFSLASVVQAIAGQANVQKALTQLP